MSGYIDNYGSPANPVIDITGTDLAIWLSFAPKNTITPIDHSPLEVVGAMTLLSNLETTLGTPLSEMFDQIWSQNLDPNGKKMRERTAAIIDATITSEVPKMGSGYSAYNIAVNLPMTGQLRSIVVDTTIELSYELNGVSASFTVTTPYSDGSFPPDPVYRVTFDIELLLAVILPDRPSFPAIPFTQAASVNIENADVSQDSFTASVFDLLKAAFNGLSDQPMKIFQTEEGQVDSSGGAPPDFDQLAALTTDLMAAWNQGYSLFGFKQLSAFIDAGQRTLNLRFTHPLDPAPTIALAGASFPVNLPAQIVTSASVVQAGGTLRVTGSGFPLGQATALYITWNDTTSGEVTESDIEWGPLGGMMMPLVSISRHGADGKNVFTAAPMQPNTKYGFRITDQDSFTNTPWSNYAVFMTTSTDAINLLLEQGTRRWNLRETSLSGNGLFSVQIAVPPSVLPGNYTLVAVHQGGPVAMVSIQVLGANQPIPPTIEVIDASTLASVPTVTAASSFILRGVGFQSGRISVAIGSAGGQELGTATSSDGTFQTTFTWPFFEPPALEGGAHTIVATEDVGDQTLQATLNVLVQVLS